MVQLNQQSCKMDKKQSGMLEHPPSRMSAQIVVQVHIPENVVLLEMPPAIFSKRRATLAHAAVLA